MTVGAVVAPKIVNPGCGLSKIRHSTRLSAEVQVLYMEARNKDRGGWRSRQTHRLHAYWCEACVAWHTGHDWRKPRGA